ncbi:hypothetical protein GCM10009654_60310 [Streptomyces hebeiensis]|uniref:Uncharacterized protein n=1 Tax=Streptomyces hebeiensis TaxID=229486 RepID=A0ABP4FQV1_9ACTN
MLLADNTHSLSVRSLVPVRPSDSATPEQAGQPERTHLARAGTGDRRRSAARGPVRSGPFGHGDPNTLAVHGRWDSSSQGPVSPVAPRPRVPVSVFPVSPRPGYSRVSLSRLRPGSRTAEIPPPVGDGIRCRDCGAKEN